MNDLTDDAGGHDITPKPGSVRQLSGQPGDILDARTYPLLAECLVCGGTVRCDAFWFADWKHLPDVTP